MQCIVDLDIVRLKFVYVCLWSQYSDIQTTMYIEQP